MLLLDMAPGYRRVNEAYRFARSAADADWTDPELAERFTRAVNGRGA
jgi:hypothetical protein